MMSITTKPLHIDFKLQKKIEFICNFCNVVPEIINGNMRTIDLTNIIYVEPHRIKIESITLLVFNYSNELYVEGSNKKIELKDLESFIKSLKK